MQQLVHGSVSYTRDSTVEWTTLMIDVAKKDTRIGIHMANIQ